MLVNHNLVDAVPQNAKRFKAVYRDDYIPRNNRDNTEQKQQQHSCYKYISE